MSTWSAIKKLDFNFDNQTSFSDYGISIDFEFSTSGPSSTWVMDRIGPGFSRSSFVGQLENFDLSDELSVLSNKDKALQEGEIAVIKDNDGEIHALQIDNSSSRGHGDAIDGVSVSYKTLLSSTATTSTSTTTSVTTTTSTSSTTSTTSNTVYDYLNFTPQTLPARPNDAMAKFHDYVDRYPLTLKTAFVADYNAGKTASQALWGQTHWFNNGQAQGRVLEVVTGQEDTNDYGAYVENYGTTLLDIYRASPASNTSNPDFMSLYNWGKWHYKTMGQAAGRQMDGGVDWGAIVKQSFDLNTKWKDAQIADPSMSAFSFGYNNQNTIKAANGVQIGRDTQEKLSGQYVYGLGGNDVLTGTSSDDLLHGGFGDDLIAHGNGGTDLVYGGPGKDVFQLHTGGTLQIRDFRKGTDFIQLGDGLTNTDVQLVFDSFSNSTAFKSGSETLALVYGTNPNDFSFAQQSEGIDNVFIA